MRESGHVWCPARLLRVRRWRPRLRDWHRYWVR